MALALLDLPPPCGFAAVPKLGMGVGIGPAMAGNLEFFGIFGNAGEVGIFDMGAYLFARSSAWQRSV